MNRNNGREIAERLHQSSAKVLPCRVFIVILFTIKQDRIPSLFFVNQRCGPYK